MSHQHKYGFARSYFYYLLIYSVFYIEIFNHKAVKKQNMSDPVLTPDYVEEHCSCPTTLSVTFEPSPWDTKHNAPPQSSERWSLSAAVQGSE